MNFFPLNMLKNKRYRQYLVMIFTVSGIYLLCCVVITNIELRYWDNSSIRTTTVHTFRMMDCRVACDSNLDIYVSNNNGYILRYSANGDYVCSYVYRNKTNTGVNFDIVDDTLIISPCRSNVVYKYNLDGVLLLSEARTEHVADRENRIYGDIHVSAHRILTYVYVTLNDVVVYRCPWYVFIGNSTLVIWILCFSILMLSAIIVLNDYMRNKLKLIQ